MGWMRVLRVHTGGRRRGLAVVALAGVVLVGCGRDDGASAALRAPADGSNVAGSAALEMSADGITIEEAGEARDGAGHFHVIIDDGCVATGDPVPKDADHVHFGKGQTTGAVYLEPGEHELCLQVADGLHNALDVTDRITITAGITDRDEWCAALGEVDVLFDELDNSDDDFAVRQAGYESTRRLLTQIDAAIEQVDAQARGDVAVAVAAVLEIATISAGAADERAAGEELEAHFATMTDSLEGAEAWIQDACGLDVSG